jgi:heat shock protein HslJ
LTIAARRRKFSLCRDTNVVSLTGSDISDIFKAELTAMANIRVRSGAIALFATAFFVGGPLLPQAPAATDVRSEVSKFQDIELRLVRFRINGKEIVIPSTVTITLTFQKGGQISGRSAVNRYGGAFTAQPNGKIAVQLATTTQMAGPPELMELEMKYFDALSHVKQILLKSDRIILENERTSIEFAFSRAR